MNYEKRLIIDLSININDFFNLFILAIDFSIIILSRFL